MAYRIPQKQLLEAIKNSAGVVSVIQRRLQQAIGKPIGWTAVKAQIDKSEKASRAARAERETMIDATETVLFTKIRQDRDGMSIRYFLNKQAKHRGYGPDDQAIPETDHYEDILSANVSDRKKLLKMAAKVETAENQE